MNDVRERNEGWSAAAAGAAAGILLLTLWLNGLFYNQDTVLLSALMCAAAGALLLMRRAVLSAAILLPLVLLLAYGIVRFLDPASVHGTHMQMIRYAMYTGWAVVISALFCRRTTDSSWTKGLQALLVVGIINSLSSLLMLGGWLPYAAGVTTSENVEISAWGFRLAGFLQYPNTLGAVTGAFLLLQLYLVQTASGFRARTAALLPVLPHMAVLLLTESRGSWLVVAFVWIVGLLFFNKRRRASIAFAARSAAWGFAGAASAASLWPDHRDMIPLAVAAAWAGSIGGEALLHRLRHSRRLGIVCSFLIAAAPAVLGLVLMPQGASERLTDHYATAGARTQFYRDAVTLWREHPWFGAGGEAWRQQFARIQSEPYVGKEVHSSFFDLLLDVGVIGTVPALILAAAALYIAWRRHRGLAMASSVLLLHSAVDFDMAFGFFALLLLALLALAAGANEPGHDRPPKRLSRTASLLLALPLGAAWLLAAVHAVAQPLADADGLLALKLTPADTELRIAVSRTLPPEEAAAMLAEGRRYERSGFALYRELALASGSLGRAADEAGYWREVIACAPFDRDLRTEAIERLAEQARHAALTGDGEKAKILAAAAEDLYHRYEAEVQRVEAMPNAANDKHFAMTEEAKRAHMAIVPLLGFTNDRR
ncbi:O-antigen ligase family protein [Paenibacillus thiaminolyticus]|uniref:O-antigen ligase family protein n=1 Tax=Paenibacillus thiaminolyticus TaxID=49283 RepID=UPI00232EF1E0|nr:O-antigen ligase family protein [Paenibacillus thiaminolyticus]WCF09450.1 O-antigen ligase family protein [Paenibacillus thiaminolyticus]